VIAHAEARLTVVPALSAERISRARDLLAGKWSVAIVLALAPHPLRYNRLLERLDGVSRRMLTATLQALVRDGLVERRQLTALPMRVEYRLSPAGSALLPVLEELERWAEGYEAWAATPPAARVSDAA
jgi:DNA-binding HxlR family transcriptional regulator